AFNGHVIGGRVECPGFDHFEMVRGEGASQCATGLTLFDSIRNDLVTVYWITQPPPAMVSGQRYPVSWQIIGGTSVSHTNIHWDIVDPKDPSRCNELTNLPCSTFNLSHGAAPTTYNDFVTAPSVSTSTTYKYVAHAIVNGVTVWSPV